MDKAKVYIFVYLSITILLCLREIFKYLDYEITFHSEIPEKQIFEHGERSHKFYPYQLKTACPGKYLKRVGKNLRKRFPNVVGLGFAKCGTGKVINTN